MRKSKARKQRVVIPPVKSPVEMLDLEHVITEEEKETHRNEEIKLVKAVMDKSLLFHALNENLPRNSPDEKAKLSFEVVCEIAKVANQLVLVDKFRGLTPLAQMKMRLFTSMTVMGNYQLRRHERLCELWGDLLQREKRVMDFIESKDRALHDEIMKVVYPEPSQPACEPEKKRGRPKREATPVTTPMELVEQKETPEDAESVTE